MKKIPPLPSLLTIVLAVGLTLEFRVNVGVVVGFVTVISLLALDTLVTVPPPPPPPVADNTLLEFRTNPEPIVTSPKTPVPAPPLPSKTPVETFCILARVTAEFLMFAVIVPVVLIGEPVISKSVEAIATLVTVPVPPPPPPPPPPDVPAPIQIFPAFIVLGVIVGICKDSVICILSPTLPAFNVCCKV